MKKHEKKGFASSRTHRAIRIYSGEEFVACFLIGGGEVLPLRGEFERFYAHTFQILSYFQQSILNNQYSLGLHHQIPRLHMDDGNGKIG